MRGWGRGSGGGKEKGCRMATQGRGSKNKRGGGVKLGERGGVKNTHDSFLPGVLMEVVCVDFAQLLLKKVLAVEPLFRRWIGL